MRLINGWMDELADELVYKGNPQQYKRVSDEGGVLIMSGCNPYVKTNLTALRYIRKILTMPQKLLMAPLIIILVFSCSVAWGEGWRCSVGGCEKSAVSKTWGIDISKHQIGTFYKCIEHEVSNEPSRLIDLDEYVFGFYKEIESLKVRIAELEKKVSLVGTSVDMSTYRDKINEYHSCPIDVYCKYCSHEYGTERSVDR